MLQPASVYRLPGVKSKVSLSSSPQDTARYLARLFQTPPIFRSEFNDEASHPSTPSPSLSLSNGMPASIHESKCNFYCGGEVHSVCHLVHLRTIAGVPASSAPACQPSERVSCASLILNRPRKLQCCFHSCNNTDRFDEQVLTGVRTSSMQQH